MNGWQRIGIVASILFIGWIVLYERHTNAKTWGREYSAAYSSCTNEQARKDRKDNFDFKPCHNEAAAVANRWAPGFPLWQIVGVAGLMTLPFWVLAYIGIWVVKWVMAGGFKTERV